MKTKQRGFSILEILIVLGVMLSITGLLFIGFNAQQRDLKVRTQSKELKILYNLAENSAMSISDFNSITWATLQNNTEYPHRLKTEGPTTVWGGGLSLNTALTVPTVLSVTNPALQWTLAGVKSADCIQLMGALPVERYYQVKIAGVLINQKNMPEITTQCSLTPTVDMDLIQVKVISAPKDELGLVGPLCIADQWNDISYDTSCGYCKLGVNTVKTTTKKACLTQWGAGTNSTVSSGTISSTCATPADISLLNPVITPCVAPKIGNITTTYQTITKCTGTPDVYSVGPTIISVDTSQCINPPCTTPWGTQVAHGASVTAYNVTSASTCANISQTRTCSMGILSGSYQFSGCISTCTPGSVSAYNATLASFTLPSGCNSIKVSACSGGGGGGGGDPSYNLQLTQNGGRGGSAGSCISNVAYALTPGVYSFNVGNGGAGGVLQGGYSNHSGGNGQNGGSTWVKNSGGALILSIPGGAGGGFNGGSGFSSVIMNGTNGANSPLTLLGGGAGGVGATTWLQSGAAGGNASATAAGGGGAGGSAALPNWNGWIFGGPGGAGAPGYVTITW